MVAGVQIQILRELLICVDYGEMEIIFVMSMTFLLVHAHNLPLFILTSDGDIAAQL